MAAPQRRGAPLPLVQAFVVCREIIEDCRSHEFVLIGPLSALGVPGFPHAARVSIYAHLTCGHGDYRVALQLRDAEERAVWEWRCPGSIRLPSPLEQHRFTLYDAILEFPESGRYDLVMLVSEEELARHALHVISAAGRD